jgi:hypothetical protein
MSEPSSLYLRLTLTEAALAAYRQSRPQPPTAYTDWLPWLATRQFYGTIDAQKIAELPFPADTSCGDYLAELVNSPYAAPTADHYDPVTHAWTLAVTMYSENYFDFIELLSVLRNVAQYKDLPSPDFILIYPYLWGDAPNAYLVVEQGASHFEPDTLAPALAEANAALKTLVDAMADSFPDEA